VIGSPESEIFFLFSFIETEMAEAKVEPTGDAAKMF